MVKIAVVSDIHLDLSGRPSFGRREFSVGEIMIKRLIDLLVRFVAPDLTVFLGDLVDVGGGAAAPQYYSLLKNHIDQLSSPVIVLPGNHDGPAFYDYFGTPQEIIDCKGVRFVSCVDPEEPGYNARRLPDQLELMKEARRGHDGEIVALQHVPVFPPGSHECPYNYVNAEEILLAMDELRINVSLSGHYHPGIEGLRRNGTVFHGVPAMCERPFCFDVIELGSQAPKIHHQQLVPDGNGPLIDTHVHTQFSYCGPTMDMRRTAELAPILGLEGAVLTEHSGQLYFDQTTYWSGSWFDSGLGTLREQKDERIGAYVAEAERLNVPHIHYGFEADCDSSGKLVIESTYNASMVLGSVHRMHTAGWHEDTGTGITKEIIDEFLAQNEGLARGGVDAIAHPFRILSGRLGKEALFSPMLEILRTYGVAAEINFHINDPPEEFFADCIKSGVKITLGSDAHEHWELGHLLPHLDFLARIGYDGDIADIVYQGRRCS